MAGGITIAGYGNGNLPLELDATGTVTQTGALTRVSNLTGTAASFELATSSTPSAHWAAARCRGRLGSCARHHPVRNSQAL